ncbi:EID1-like F-box protein 3 [Punica granatum]|uniref:Uncharacterized protein n=2 Tax=Punica granatum TaxID=22663 RepID=A0A218WYP1_PUNGR|nr:EID1-like F-box protein 3 [Punica granatum]OWM77917.1 hypothetical protein CDL15_Pgr018486 [Punica granatum]PKI74314.1 hypothetical protein CRG98_005290 [Punica granatum]
MTPNQRLRRSGDVADSAEPGLVDERVLVLVFESISWDLQLLCVASAVNRKIRAIAKRVLWRQLCMHRAPRMVASLMGGTAAAGSGGRIAGGWPALAKLMFYCCGSDSSRHLRLDQRLPGHFVETSRFSKTSGQSFLPRRCRGDLLYVCDPCEHQMGSEEEDLGVYRGVFKGFMNSRTRACLIWRQVALEDRPCPYCGARVWSMTTARLVPRSAARRLGSGDGRLEYFVCVNGHLHGTCWLIPLSSDEGDRHDEEEDDEEDDDDDESGNCSHINGIQRTATDGSTSSTGEEIVGYGSPQNYQSASGTDRH